LRSLDENRQLGAPYWPESFWTDVQEAMKTQDLATMVFFVYSDTYSYETMEEVNSLLSKGGREAYLASPVGAAFCAKWDARQAEGKKATQALTLQVLNEVYEKHKTEIKAARAKYLAAHPDYKD